MIQFYCHSSLEMVEHDVPPEDMQEPVVEEPHHQSGSPIPEPHDDEQPGDKKTEPESDQTLAAVTGFFSGFATVVSNIGFLWNLVICE